MPLHVDSLSSKTFPGDLLAWVLNTNELKKQQVGKIEIQGRHATIEIPDKAGARLVKRLDGQKLKNRSVQVWHEGQQDESDLTGHFAKLNEWLLEESRAEAEQAAEWQQASGENESSTSLGNLVIRSEDTGLGGSTILVLSRRSPMQPLPINRFSTGSPITLVEQSQPNGARQRGIITQIEKNQIQIALAKPPLSDSDNPTYRIDLSDDEITLQRSTAALNRARHASQDRLSELRDICLGLKEPHFTDPSTLPFEDPNLNDSQKAAIHHAHSANDIAIIHGPPGTGKTRTLVELIRQAIKAGEKVLVCAPSNLGVDNLFERLLNRGTNAVRLGHLARVLPSLREHCLTALVPQHPNQRQIKKLRHEAAQLFRKIDKPSRDLDRNARKELREEAKHLLADAREMEADIAEEIVDKADVICATNTGITTDTLGNRRFDLVVIDEACQCTEPSCWIPLLRARRLVFAGDHCQLPPTVISQKAAGEGYSKSLQERLVDLYGDTITRPLLTQYRMHRDIMQYSSAEFYDNQLSAADSVADHLLKDLPQVKDDELTTKAVRFIDTSGSSFDELPEEHGSSLANPQEADLAIKKAIDLIDLGIPAEDIGILTPYTAQVQQLNERLNHPGIEIGSIDSFQGREKEVIIISLVRSNPNHEIGFLADTRRMNVALTRARRKLIVIGDSTTIASHPFYARLLDHFDQIDAYRGVWDE